MTITYGNVFAENQYLEIASYVDKYFREQAKSNGIPLIETKMKDQRQYRQRPEGDPDVSFGTNSWTAEGIKAQSKFGKQDFDLHGVQMILEIPNDNINDYTSENYLAEAYDQQIRKWVADIDDSNFHGVLDRSTQVILNQGILGSVTTTENLSTLADEDISAKGEIYLAIKKMVQGIPFRIRDNLPNGVDVYVSSNLAEELADPSRIYQDKLEWDFLYEKMIGPTAVPSLKIRNYIVTDKILAKATDDTSGVNADTVDTQGTHDRILVMAPAKEILARVVSNWDLLGEEKKMLQTNIAYGYRGRCCIFDVNGVDYSEALTV